jgi:hypothetical protein
MGVTDLIHDPGHRPVDRPIYPLKRIPEDRKELCVMRRVRRIVDMPALVPSAVGFRKHLNKEIPLLSPQNVERQLGLFRDGQFESFQERVEIGGTLPQAVAVGGQGVGTYARHNAASDFTRRSLKAKYRIMATPFHDLKSIEIRFEPAERHVQHCYPATGVRSEFPEGRAANSKRSV